MSQNLEQRLQSIRDDADKKILELRQVEEQIKEREKNLEYTSDIVKEKLGDLMESDKFVAFFKKPYIAYPSSKKNEVLVFVPKFIKGFQVGWMIKEDESFYVYRFDQYSSWLGDAPKELLETISFKHPLEGTVVSNGVLSFPPAMKDEVVKKLGEHIKEVSENDAKVVRGHEFQLIADIIESGSLPFKPTPVAPEDLRPASSVIKLRTYQEPAVKKFMEVGAVGEFLPTGGGKSFIALYLIDILKGKKLIVVPTRTLADQWAYYIETHVPRAKDEVKIVTYQGFRDYDEQFILTIFDECQRLPADTFSRLAVIQTKYRLGLSAAPYREDGREKYVFALTGFPCSLNWKEYMETAGRSYHPVDVWVVKSAPGKLKKLDELLDRSKKTIIFADTIELGKRVAAIYNIPYVYGDSVKRLDIIENNNVLVASRVLDLGVSIKNLQRIIEIDFLGGSRAQSIQRTGRLMHSEAGDLKHDVIMTESELTSYGKRLWSLQDQGFTVKIHE